MPLCHIAGDDGLPPDVLAGDEARGLLFDDDGHVPDSNDRAGGGLQEEASYVIEVLAFLARQAQNDIES